jgi:hypothetical protein
MIFKIKYLRVAYDRHIKVDVIRPGAACGLLTALAATFNHLPMKSTVVLALAFISTFAVASHGLVHHHRRQCTTAGMGSNPGEPNTDGWSQVAKGNASFTVYSGCQSACKLCGSYFRGLVVHGSHADPGGGLLF